MPEGGRETHGARGRALLSKIGEEKEGRSGVRPAEGASGGGERGDFTLPSGFLRKKRAVHVVAPVDKI